MCVLVLAERTTTSAQYYSALQKYCMLDLGFTLIPVPSQREAASLLSQMVTYVTLVIFSSFRLEIYLGKDPEDHLHALKLIIYIRYNHLKILLYQNVNSLFWNILYPLYLLYFMELVCVQTCATTR